MGTSPFLSGIGWLRQGHRLPLGRTSGDGDHRENRAAREATSTRNFLLLHTSLLTVDPELWRSVLLLGPQNYVKDGAPARASVFPGMVGVSYE